MTEQRAPRRGRPAKRTEEGRNRRIPLGTATLKLSVPDGTIPEGYVGRIIKGDPARLQRAMQAGYEYVEDPYLVTGEGAENTNTQSETRVKFLVGRNPDGSPRYDYLMKIRKEWYDEDQDAKQAAIDETDDVIRNGKLNEKAEDMRYVPKEGIKIA